MKLTAGTFCVELLPRRHVDDEDWVRVQVLIASRGFSGDFETWLQLGDLRRFRSEVSSMHAAVGVISTATLACAEPDIKLTLRMQSLGGILGSYEFESERLNGTPTALSGAFECDQSYLSGMLQSIDVLVNELQSENAA